MKYIFFLLLTCSLLFSHDERLDEYTNFQTPEKIFSGEKLNRLRSEQEVSLEKKIKNYEQALDEYYSQFIGEKNIQHDRDRQGEFKDKQDEVHPYFKIHSGKISLKTDVNSVRLLADSYRKGLVQSNLIRDSETLFVVHSELADLYEKTGEPHQALEHYLAAFRYCNLSLTEEYFSNEKSFREMKSSTDAESIRTYLSKREELEKAKKNLQDMIDEIHLLEAEAMRSSLKTGGKNLNLGGQRGRIDSEKERVKKLEEEVEKEKKERFLPYKEKKGNEFASVLVKYAELVRSLELQERVRMRALKSDFPLIDLKRESGFFGYISILEFAHKLSPSDPSILHKLGIELKSSGKNRESLDYFLKFIQLPEERKSDKKQNREVFLAIGSLYSDLTQFVNAAPYYERYFELIEDEKEKNSIRFFLGEFYLRRLGDVEKSFENFNSWLVNQKDNPVSVKERAILERKKFLANFGISKYKRFSKKSVEEEASLEEAYSSYKKIIGELANKEKEIIQKKSGVLTIKKTLLNVTDPQTISIYKEENEKLAGLEKEWEDVKLELKSIPIVEFLLRKAEREEIRKEFKKAISSYREILQFGSEVENSLALKNITRIEKILADGFPRAIVRD